MPDMWLDVDTAVVVPVNILPLIDDIDFKSIETAVVYDSAGMALTWNFVTSAGVVSGTAVTPTTAGVYDWSEPIADKGMYAIEIPASGGASINNDTEGYGWFTGVATGVLPWRGPTIGFRAAGLNDKLCDSAYDATRGLAGTALPASAADAAGGLPISDAGGLDLDAERIDVAAILVDTGTTLDGRIPAALTANGNMKSSLMEILATALTETAGQIAGAFKKFFDKATPTGTVNSIPDAVAGAAGGLFIAGTNAATAVTTALTANVTGNLSGSIGSLGITAKADVNAEVVDALATDTYAEPGQEAPAATASIVKKIGYLFKAWRNRSTATATQYTLYADDATTVDQKAVISDDTVTFDRNEVGSGP